MVAGRGPGTAWIHARPLARSGGLYGLYLWHLPLMLFGTRLGVLPHAFLPRLAAVLVPALAVATLSWLLVERTLLERASRRAGERRRAAPVPSGRAALEARAAP